MKDYSMNSEEKKKFILGYKIKNGFMKIKYALGFKDTVLYTEKNENKVLNKMKEQVSNVDEKKFINKQKNNIYGFFSCGTMFLIGSICLFCMNIAPGMEIFAKIFGPMFLISSIFTISNGFISLSKLRDYKRNKRFIDVEEKLNSKVRANENMLVNTSSKTRNMVNSIPENKPVFNINNFSFVPNRDLNQIIDNIDRDDYFKFDYESIKNKPKTRTRKPV